MSLARRFAILLLALPLIFSGGLLDLCACSAEGHGFFCADDEDAGCHAAVAPVSCCAKVKQPEPTEPAANKENCGCPVVELGALTAEPPPAPDAAPTTPAAWIHSLASSADGALAVVPTATRRTSKPPPGTTRLHVLLSVFRL